MYQYIYINTKRYIKSISIYLFRLQEKWNEIQSFAPLHMMKVEFRLDEETFVKYVKDVEKGKIKKVLRWNHRTF